MCELAKLRIARFGTTILRRPFILPLSFYHSQGIRLYQHQSLEHPIFTLRCCLLQTHVWRSTILLVSHLRPPAAKDRTSLTSLGIPMSTEQKASIHLKIIVFSLTCEYGILKSIFENTDRKNSMSPSHVESVAARLNPSIDAQHCTVTGCCAMLFSDEMRLWPPRSS